MLIPRKMDAQHLLICALCRTSFQAGCARVLLQVFEYLSTDLKKFMDRTGKGNANPMPPKLIKVTVQFIQCFVYF